MKKGAALFFLALIAFLASFATPGQEPVRTITNPATTGKTDGWTSVDFKEGNVSVKFPGTPKTEFSPTSPEGALFAERYFSYQEPGNKAYYSIQVISNSYLVEDTDTLKEYYDNWIRESSSDPQYKGLKSEIAYLGDHPGRQFQVLRFGGKLKHTSRLFILGGTVYQVQAMMRTDLSITETETLENSIKTFFESVKLIEPRTPITRSIEDVLPKAYRGAVKDGKYLNAGFGVEMEMPAGWIPVAESELTELEKYAHHTVGERSPTKRVKVIFGASRRPFGSDSNSVFTILIEKLKFKGVSLQETATRNRNVLRSQAVEFRTNLLKDITEEVINGTRFSTITSSMVMDGRSYKQKQYLLVKNNYYFLFTGTAGTDTELAEFESAFQTIKFK